MVLQLVLWRRDGICVFFFSSRRRHTRLQGDWSSDVCSSDLPPALLRALAVELGVANEVLFFESVPHDQVGMYLEHAKVFCLPRSEERRVGKECRSRWSPYH